MRPLKEVYRSVPILIVVLIMALGAGWLTEAGAQAVLPSPDLPPDPDPRDCEDIISLYVGAGVHAVFPGGIDMSEPQHSCFQNVVREDVGGDEHETFDSVLDALVDVGTRTAVPITLTGPVTTIVYGKTGNTTGTFDTEIVALSLSGDMGGMVIEIRESPSLPSTGQTTITDLGGGLFEIDSFFDVFTELSVDGGPWMPQTNEAGHMVLVPLGPSPVESATWGTIKALYK